MHSLTQTDTLLDLHAKLATVVRYYDRMLEDRLSSTYSQHSISGYQNTQRQQSQSMYPQIPTEPYDGQGGTESYYNMNAPTPTNSYPSPHPHYQQYPPQSQSPYMRRDRAPSSNNSSQGVPAFQNQPHYQAQPPPRTSSISGYMHDASHNNEPFYPAQQQQGQNHQFQQPQSQPPPQTPTRNPSNSYYTKPSNPEVSPPDSYAEPPLSYQQPPQQQFSQPPPNKATQPPQQEPQLQQYYQQPPPGAPPQLSQDNRYPTNYSRDNFPPPPQHQPLQAPKEEALIEL